MANDWARLCQIQEFTIDGDEIHVALAEGRSQRVSVSDLDSCYELQSIVARPAVLAGVPDVPLRAWKRNRSAHLVGFRFDTRRRLIGQSWVPKAGLTAEEFRTYVRRIAVECDRFEYLLTGADRE